MEEVWQAAHPYMDTAGAFTRAQAILSQGREVGGLRAAGGGRQVAAAVGGGSWWRQLVAAVGGGSWRRQQEIPATIHPL